MSATTDRVRRLLALVPYLRSHPGVAMEEAAQAFGVSLRQLEKDLWLLFTDCGLPGYLPGDLIDIDFGPDGVWVTEDAGLQRPIRLTPEEGLAVIVALRALRDSVEDAQRDSVERATAKLESAVATQSQPRVEVTPPAPAEHEDTVRTAVRSQRALYLRYYTAGRDEVTERTVDPVRVLVADGHRYLIAYCRRAAGVRLFRFDRIDDARVLEEAAAAPADLPVPRLPFARFAPGPGDTSVELRLEPSAAWVAEYYPCEEVVRTDQGALQVRVRFRDLAMARRLVLGLGPACEVLGPAYLAEQVRRAASEALESYGSAPLAQAR